VATLPTPCARDGKGPGLPYGLPDLLEPGGTRHALLPTPTARVYGSNRSPSPGATRRPGLHQWAGQLLPKPTAGGGTGYMSGSQRDTWRPTLESAVQGYLPTPGGKPAHPGGLLPTPTVADSRSSANATAGRTTPSAGHAGRTLTDAARLLPTPRASDTGTPGRRAGAGFRPPLSQVLLPTPRATDGAKGCPGQRGSHGDLTLPSAAVRVLPTPRASDGHGPSNHGDGGIDLTTAVAELPDRLGELDEARWGVYAAAVARWETLLDRPVPEPTQPGRHGKPVLAPPFVEWLMGLDEGWVTDPALALPRTLALRVLGNGVVPQQAAVALRLLLCPHRWAVPA
jgi:DNA (cytosine-5)-methyltransferase 1